MLKMPSLSDQAYWLEWFDKHAPNYKGPQPTKLGYKLLAAYAICKRASKRAVCFIIGHNPMAEDIGDEYVDRIAWNCTRCGEGGVINLGD